MVQAGISSKALAFGGAENKYKYNGIEKENDLQIEIYDAQFRELDAQVGRWWQIDPKTENMEMWSPYVSNYDNPITYSDPLGDEGEECCKGLLNAIVQVGKDVLTFTIGAANALATNQMGGAGRGNPNSYSDPHDAAISQSGQTAGDILSIGVAGVATVGSFIGAVGSDGALAPVLIPAAIHQITIAAPTAVKNLVKDFSGDRVNSTPGKYSHLKEPKKVEPGAATTPAQRKRILEENKKQNQGQIKSDGDGRNLNPPKKLNKGEKADPNAAEIDHIDPRVPKDPSKPAGSNSNANQRVLSKEENQKKSNN